MRDRRECWERENQIERATSRDESFEANISTLILSDFLVDFMCVYTTFM